MMADEPTMATNRGGSPARIAGITNSSSTAKLTPSPTSALKPRQRPNATMTSAARPSMSRSGWPRW